MLYNEIEDQELVRQAAAGSREAFGELVSRHHQMVRTMLMRALGHRSEVDDVAQEVFLSALRGVAGFRQQSSFRTWLLSIARNQAITHLRKQRTLAGQTLNGLDRLVLQHQIASVADGYVEPPNMAALQACLGQLNEDHQHLIKEIYFQDRSAAEVARQTGQAKNAVRMRLMRIRKALSACMQRQTRG